MGVVLRFGTFYAADTGHTQMQIKTARRGLYPFPGPVEGYVSLIQMDDAARAVVAALDVAGGTYNVVDDEPVTRATIARIVADALGKKKLHSVPRALMRGPLALLARSERVSNAKFKAAAGWKPKYPTAREGWPATIADAEAAASKR